MQVLINCEKNMEAVKYGFFSIGDILGLDIAFVDQISNKIPIPVLLYYGEAIPEEMFWPTG